MKRIKNISIYRKLVLAILFLVCFQTYSFAQERTVDDILKETQNAMEQNQNMRFDMNYKWFGTYTAKKPSISYLGNLIKSKEIIYSKINNTFFITDPTSKTSIKCNEAEKALIIQSNITINNDQSPVALLSTFIKLFKIKKVKDNGSQWICTLTTDVITQLPYGKVEIYINKETALVEKEVLYFLTKAPYKNEEGQEKIDNPRMEITLSNYKTSLSKQEKNIAKIDSYILRNGKRITPTTAYKEFKISQY
ncbi:hypothetical protein [uncultured Kordia sp.]|uniref:hypothetical protein n=1 Tax=uncultured Kordia sp. TaxID=507699 RepID=UPI002630CC45|nr:hypothetical protein [uncultured Kordia sp.]